MHNFKMNIESKLIMHPPFECPYSKLDSCENTEYQLFCVNIGDDAVACAVIDKIPTSFGLYKLHLIEVMKEHRNKGIGSYLLKFLIETYKEIYLDPVSNAVNFFIKYGAIPIAKHFCGDVLLYTERDAKSLANSLFYGNKRVKIISNFDPIENAQNL